jgi:hypothetical protein
MTISGTTQKIFINGVLQQTANTFNTPTVVAGKSAILGAIVFTDGVTVYNEPTAGNFQGKMDDFRFYNTAMTDSEVQHLYDNEASGLVAYYPFNGNANDESGNGNDGINHNGIFSKDRFRNNNSSMLFYGSDSYVEGTNPGNNLPTGNSPRTITAWIKEYSFHPWGNNIFHYGLDQAAPTNFHLYTTDVIRFGNGYDYGVVAGTTPIADSSWHFVAGVYEGGTERIAKVYVDGKLDGTGVLSTEPNTILGSKWRIGRFMTGSNNFDGEIDEVKIYDRALTGIEIEREYNITRNSLVAYYPFNGNANDESGNNLHLTNHGAVLTADRFGIENNAYFFNGNANISRTDNDLLDLVNDFSISFWVKNPGSVLHQFVMSKHYAGEDNIGSWGIASYGDGNTYTFVATPQWGFGPPNPTTPIIPENVWHHITFTYKKATSEWKSFMDGLLSGSGTQTFNIQNTDRDFMIGTCMQYNSNLTASLDDLRVYTSALTDQEIEDVYLSETTAPVLLRPENLSTVSIITPLMEWKNSNTNAEYKFQLSTDSKFATVLHEISSVNSTYQLPEGILGLLNDGTTCYWRVRTTLNGETGPWSDVWNFSYTNTGINKDPSTSPALTVMPNPSNSSGKVIYSVPTSGTSPVPVTIEIINSVGKITDCLVSTKLAPGIYEINIATALMEPGIYFVRLKAGNTITVRKLVIMH